MIASVLKPHNEVAGKDLYPMFWWSRIPTDDQMKGIILQIFSRVKILFKKSNILKALSGVV